MKNSEVRIFVAASLTRVRVRRHATDARVAHKSTTGTDGYTLHGSKFAAFPPPWCVKVHETAVRAFLFSCFFTADTARVLSYYFFHYCTANVILFYIYLDIYASHSA